MTAAERILEVAADLPVGDRLRLVVDSDDTNPETKLDRIERGLASGELPVEVSGQISGIWIAPYEVVPATMPEWLPTGALLPRRGESLSAGAILLDLVPIDYVWFPLSLAGTYTYAHAAGLRRGEVWRFIPRDAAATPWPTVYDATLGEPLDAALIEGLYGDEAARRARADEKSVQIRLTRASQ